MSDDVCRRAREVAHRHSSMDSLAAELAAEFGVALTRNTLQCRYRRWRAKNPNEPSLGELLRCRAGRFAKPALRGEFADEATDPGCPAEPAPSAPAVEVQQLRSCLQWGTGLERQAVEAFVASGGSVAGAAEALGMPPTFLRGLLSDLRRRAAAAGWAPEHDMTKTVPAGLHVKGVSNYYDADGNLKGQWVKSAKDQEHRLEALLDAIQGMTEPFRGLAEPVPVLSGHADDLLCVYPMGDPHLGMYAWAEETGQNFDLEIAERNLVGAVDHLVALAPPAREALVVSLGDFFHSDNSSHTTGRSGNSLDVDTRWAKVLAVGLRTMRRVVDRALLKHERVTVICEIGNHDDHTSVMLAHGLSLYYEREPRVVVDTSPSKFHWYRFGANLVGTTHGDTVKLQDLPGVMACDRREDWGETEHRYFYVGHVHHERVREFPGCVVETFRTLASRDAWHSAQGYRSGQDMRLDVLHKKYGRVNRHIVGIRQVWERVGAGEG